MPVTAASGSDRAAVAELAEAAQDERVAPAYVDRGRTGGRPAFAELARGGSLASGSRFLRSCQRRSREA
jgi:hypothetical protein